MGAWRVLVRKEVTEVLRDRRTLFFTFVLPIVLYPVLLMGMAALVTIGKDRLRTEPLVVAWATPEAEALLGAHLPPLTTGRPLLQPEAEAALAARTVDAVVVVTPEAARAFAAGGEGPVTVLYTRRYDKSAEALDRLRPVVEALSAQALTARLSERHLETGFATPLKVDPKDVDFDRNLGALVASQLLPVTLLLWLLMGAMNSAVDLLAGEKERGTLETLLVSAVHPRDVLRAKATVVLGLAVASTLSNLLAMALTFGVGIAAGGGKALSYDFSALQVLTLAACLLPAALLFTALAVALAAFARTQREGQTLASLFLLVGLGPAMAAQMPGLELSTGTALVPVLNVALLVKAVILRTTTAPLVAEVVGTVLAFSALAVWFATRVFDSEFARLGGTWDARAVFHSLWPGKSK